MVDGLRLKRWEKKSIKKLGKKVIWEFFRNKYFKYFYSFYVQYNEIKLVYL